MFDVIIFKNLQSVKNVFYLINLLCVINRYIDVATVILNPVDIFNPSPPLIIIIISE